MGHEKPATLGDFGVLILYFSLRRSRKRCAVLYSRTCWLVGSGVALPGWYSDLQLETFISAMDTSFQCHACGEQHGF
jgi:hypothetical protein